MRSGFHSARLETAFTESYFFMNLAVFDCSCIRRDFRLDDTNRYGRYVKDSDSSSNKTSL